MSKKTLIILTIPVLVLTAVPLALPETPEDLQSFGLRAMKALPEFFKEIWQGFVNALLRAWDWIKAVWNSYLKPFFQNIWQKTKNFFVGEYERRKSSAREEFSKDKEKVQEDIKSLISKIPQSIWRKIKGIFK